MRIGEYAPGGIADCERWGNFCARRLTDLAFDGRVMMAREERKSVGWRRIALPVYWLMLSAAAWRAVCELPYKPFFWDKTPHTAANIRQKLRSASRVRLQAATLGFYSCRSSALARN
jgi:hypothetical protein